MESHCFCFTEPEVSPAVKSVTLSWRESKFVVAKWTKLLNGQKERQGSIRKWQLFSRAKGVEQFPSLVAKVTGCSASWCSGQPLDMVWDGGLYFECFKFLLL